MVHTSCPSSLTFQTCQAAPTALRGCGCCCPQPFSQCGVITSTLLSSCQFLWNIYEFLCWECSLLRCIRPHCSRSGHLGMGNVGKRGWCPEQGTESRFIAWASSSEEIRRLWLLQSTHLAVRSHKNSAKTCSLRERPCSFSLLSGKRNGPNTLGKGCNSNEMQDFIHVSLEKLVILIGSVQLFHKTFSGKKSFTY